MFFFSSFFPLSSRLFRRRAARYIHLYLFAYHMPIKPLSNHRYVATRKEAKPPSNALEGFGIGTQPLALGTGQQKLPVSPSGDTGGARLGRPTPLVFASSSAVSKTKVVPAEKSRPLPLFTSKGPPPPPLSSVMAGKGNKASEQKPISSSKLVSRVGKSNVVTPSVDTKTGEVDPKENTSSLLDNMPIEACLEYLTRPHRSWDSATRIRELQKQRAENSNRAARRRSSMNSLSASLQFSDTSSVANLSVHSAPAGFGRLGSNPSRTDSKGGVIRRARFGSLPSAKPELDGLMVGGTSFAVGRPPSRLQPLSSSGEVRSLTAESDSSLARNTRLRMSPQSFSFSMR
uniref:Uncharacterized protein n=1 Tax=Trypanosoma congolense (strain IL3000) TaxID=1068625 RepID=G0URU1_TRYCI|nr:conserved hypothetical protein [Trypanosoma congolense IL3000]